MESDSSYRTKTGTREMRYVALLRGINVGGNALVKMADLQHEFASLGCTNVRTILASGNVVFDSRISNIKTLQKKIETALKNRYGRTIKVLLRTQKDIQNIIESNPFKGIIVRPNTRLYVTFLSEKPTSTLHIPYVSENKAFRIFKLSKGALFSALTLVPESRTVDLMGIIEKEFGKHVTTRNWNTVMKIAKV